MMPLMFANPGDEVTIKKVGGSAETKKHLEDLGFVVGGTLTVGFVPPSSVKTTAFYHHFLMALSGYCHLLLFLICKIKFCCNKPFIVILIACWWRTVLNLIAQSIVFSHKFCGCFPAR